MMDDKGAIQLTIETLVIIIGAVVILLVIMGLLFVLFIAPASGLVDIFPFLNITKMFGG